VDGPARVSEYLVERLALGGADKICFVISPNKTDIIRYYGARFEESAVAYVVQPEPAGLCDAFFRAAPSWARTSPWRWACRTPSGFRRTR
jgi:dTDP-glucose pyrophosphorylase